MIKPFKKKNIGAYLKVMAVYVVLTIVVSFIYDILYQQLSFVSISTIILVLISIFLGMSIMFTASLLNLKKLLPAFKQMAEGKTNVNIPSVWCPVLTSASEAATEMCEKINNKQKDQEEKK